MFILRPYQSAAVSAFWSFLRGQSGNPVIVLPTGAGKSLVIAQVCHDAVKRFNGKVIVLAHRKELLSQNADKIRRLAPDLDIGIYSAGLRKRDGLDADVCVAGIQSIFKKAYDLGQRHLVLIDEVHLVPRDGEGMYQHFLTELQSANEKVRARRPDRHALPPRLRSALPTRRHLPQGLLLGTNNRPHRRRLPLPPHNEARRGHR